MCLLYSNKISLIDKSTYPASTTHRSKKLDQCWANGVDGGPTLDRCVMFAGIVFTNNVEY